VVENMQWMFARRKVVLSLSLAACQGARIQDGDDVDLSGVNDREGDACEAWAEERACGENDAGVQYCGVRSDDGEEILWGGCLAETECEPGESEACDPDHSATRTCRFDDGEPAWSDCEVWDEGGETPLVLVFPGDQIEYREAGTASFSLGGECTTHDWPSAATPWLAIDLDDSGSIDGGHELFGSGTALRSGMRAEHGFAALAELDENGDGLITRDDRRFAELLLWSDHDGDRRSTHWEHESLASRGVIAIPVAFASDRECDARGNCAVERAAVELQRGDGTRRAEVVDVHLACQ
jgi:hypothetical protein